MCGVESGEGSQHSGAPGTRVNRSVGRATNTNLRSSKLRSSQVTGQECEDGEEPPGICTVRLQTWQVGQQSSPSELWATVQSRLLR